MSVYHVQDNRRFRRDPDPGSSGIFRCRVCSKRTRETGFDEAGVQLCKTCLFTSYRENGHSDNGHAGKGLGPDPHKCTVCTADYPVLGAVAPGATGGAVLGGLNADSPEVREFLAVWHDNGRDLFERSYPNLDYDRDQVKRATTRRRYIALDEGTSGRFLVDRLTHRVFSIKAYGVPNYYAGTIESLTANYLEATAKNRLRSASRP